MPESSTRIVNALEVVAVFVVWQFVAKIAVTLASAASVTLPDMPLLRHTYLGFTFIVVLMVWLKLRGENWASFGLIDFKARYLAFGLALAIVGIVLDVAVRAIATPLIVQWTGADPHLDEKTFAEIKDNLPLFMLVVPSIWLFAAFGEEFLFRGYFQSRLAEIFGGSTAAWVFAIIAQAIVFALGHWYQGPVGMFPIFVGAVLFGAVSVIWGRNLWPLIVAHGLIDTLGFTLLYLGQPLSSG